MPRSARQRADSKASALQGLSAPWPGLPSELQPTLEFGVIVIRLLLDFMDTDGHFETNESLF